MNKRYRVTFGYRDFIVWDVIEVEAANKRQAKINASEILAQRHNQTPAGQEYPWRLSDALMRYQRADEVRQ